MPYMSVAYVWNVMICALSACTQTISYQKLRLKHIPAAHRTKGLTQIIQRSASSAAVSWDY